MHFKRTILPSAFFTALFFLASCASKPADDTVIPATIKASDSSSDTTPILTATSDSNTVPYTATAGSEPVYEKTRVLKHKGTEAGMNLIPLWVEAYMNGGLEAVGQLKDYEGTTCYINEACSPVLSEAYETALAELPEPGAREVSGWWMLLRRADPDDATEYTDEYIVYVLYTKPDKL